jgi:hypothetical protein
MAKFIMTENHVNEILRAEKKALKEIYKELMGWLDKQVG